MEKVSSKLSRLKLMVFSWIRKHNKELSKELKIIEHEIVALIEHDNNAP